MPNIFNIPTNYFFLETLSAWLQTRFDKDLSEVKILLPTRRSCRELQKILLRQGLSPQIIAISDLPSSEKVLSGIDQLLFLVDEIKKQQVFGEVDFAQAFKISLRLRDLFDEIEREQIDVKKFYEIDDSNLSEHRQITLDFIKEFYAQIKNSLLKKDVLFATAHQNFSIQEFSKSLTPDSKIVIAGSTGSVPAVRNLIKAISQLKNGFVVLQGAWSGSFLEENHPQFFVNQLIKFLGEAPKEIVEDRFKMSSQARQDMLLTLMLQSDKIVNWQKNEVSFDVENFHLIEARSEIEEAEIIVNILAEEKKSALITNNRNLAKLVKLRLKRRSIPFNDARNLDIFDSPLINFLLLILELRESNFNSHSLLALLKHPLCSYSQQQEIIAEFEIKILRQDRSETGLVGILRKLKFEPQLEEFFSDFLTKINFPLVKVAENLSKKTWEELLSQESAKKEISEFFLKLEERNYLPHSAEDFKMLLSQITYFEESDSEAQIQILSRIEARLLNFDLVIIASLNEGDFPAVDGENWLGKKIKKDLGIDYSLKKIGQSAFDFCNHLSNKSVVLTRSRSRNGVALIESPFLLKLKTLCQKNGINLFRTEKINYPEAPFFNDLAAIPKKEFRPKKFSLTEISDLISDPYSIYAKKILQLRELPKIDFEPSYAEFGSFVHKALEEIVKNPRARNFEIIFEKYFLAKEAKLIWWPKFEKIFSNFIEENKIFSDAKNETEKPIKINIGEILISGKIDRIIFDQKGEAQIFDYKTGQVPSKKDVIAGIEPQLTIAALALINEYKINSLNYWKLSYSKEGDLQNISKDPKEILRLVDDVRLMLEGLLGYFSNDENIYQITKKTAEGCYKNLARCL
ncbi:MAG: PD-(D/E)XK nuclease family protein [Proteobacteria bacterium]|nr:PD-(D/E)XK nuclease family protein [Pseudomonadota bacterium]